VPYWDDWPPRPPHGRVGGSRGRWWKLLALIVLLLAYIAARASGLLR
jgi:hypothetical protein